MILRILAESAPRRCLTNPSLARISQMIAPREDTLIGGTRTGDEYDLSSGESRLYEQGVACYESNNEIVKFSGITVSARSVSSDPYLIGKSDTYVSFEQIVAYL